MDGRRLYEKVAKRMPLSIAQPLDWAQLPLDTQNAWMDAANSVTEEIEDDCDTGCDCPIPGAELDGEELYKIWARGRELLGHHPLDWKDLEVDERKCWDRVADVADCRED